MTAKQPRKTAIWKVIKGFFLVLGIMFFIMLVTALTPLPFYMQYHLGTSVKSTDTTIDHVVLFGGAGMPSESNLMRLYYSADFAAAYHCPVIVVHPDDSICEREMRRFLTAYGVEDIRFMGRGSNTRSQVLALAQDSPQLTQSHLLVVTSPEHMKRTLLSMRKAGFQHVAGQAAHEATIDFDLSLRRQELGQSTKVHTVESTQLRYTFWNYLQLEFVCFREYIALAYYKAKGWI